MTMNGSLVYVHTASVYAAVSESVVGCQDDTLGIVINHWQNVTGAADVLRVPVLSYENSAR